MNLKMDDILRSKLHYRRQLAARPVADKLRLLDQLRQRSLNIAATRLGWSARGMHRVLKVARTVADLALADSTQVSHLAQAMQYRNAAR